MRIIKKTKEKNKITVRKTLSNLLRIWLLLLGIWGVIRYFAAEFTKISDINFFVFQIIFQPLVWVFPLLLYIKFYEKKNVSYLGLIKKNAFISIVIGLTLGIVEYILIQLLSAYFLHLFGYIDFSTIHIWINPQYSITMWIVLMTLTVFPVIAFSEELFFRGFIQTRATEAISPLKSISLSACLFVVAHLPRVIIVHRYNFSMAACYLVDLFLFGILVGYFFYKFKNLFGCIAWHGISDWLLYVWVFEFKWLGKSPPYEESWALLPASISYLISFVIIIFLIHLSFIIVQRWQKKPKRVTSRPITAQCPYCQTTFQITLTKKPLKVKCPKCGKKSMLR
ncbi:MAG: CPBP family glutamic-type intramembrane protease [Candidatus Thermoplasmatota archaeon]|nr:CPBP family glutamic-type intramembrane protease [Candidatus Thermoplasmatota archaeon]